jgi:hypothetical protein
MIDIEISKALALAIGWKPEQIRINADEILMLQATDAHFARPFDYRDWTVIAPIAERYDYFPNRHPNGWRVLFTENFEQCDTPQKAIALAVIAGAKKGPTT